MTCEATRSLSGRPLLEPRSLRLGSRSDLLQSWGPLQPVGCGALRQRGSLQKRRSTITTTIAISIGIIGPKKFLSLWRTKFSVLMARERGRIGDAILGDIPKRLWAHAFDEMDDGPAR